MTNDAFRPTHSLVRALAGAPIRVGSRNAAKLEAVRAAFGPFKKEGRVLDLIPVDVDSGVPDQPIGLDQIVCGARNRARNAFDGGAASLAVGIEDGLTHLSESAATGESETSSNRDADLVFNIGCAWLTDGEREGHGFSAAFSYPPGCLEPALRGQLPIGDLFDRFWREHRGRASGAASEGDSERANTAVSGRQGGNIGILTDGRLLRSAYAAQAVVCALVRFLHVDLYD